MRQERRKRLKAEERAFSCPKEYVLKDLKPWTFAILAPKETRIYDTPFLYGEKG